MAQLFSADEAAFFDTLDGAPNRWGDDPSMGGEESICAAMVALTPGAHVFVTQRMPFWRDVLRLVDPEQSPPNITHHGIVVCAPSTPDEACIVHRWREGDDPIPRITRCSLRQFINAERAAGKPPLNDATVRRRVGRFGLMFYGEARGGVGRQSSRCRRRCLPGQAPRSRLYCQAALPSALIVANAERAVRGDGQGIFSLGNTCEHLAMHCTLGATHHASAQLEGVFKAVEAMRDQMKRLDGATARSSCRELAVGARAQLVATRDAVGAAGETHIAPAEIVLRTLLDVLHLIGAPLHDVDDARSAVDSIAYALRAQAWHVVLLMSPQRIAADVARDHARGAARTLQRDACALCFELGVWSQTRMWTPPSSSSSGYRRGAAAGRPERRAPAPRRRLQLWLHAPSGILPGAHKWKSETVECSLPVPGRSRRGDHSAGATSGAAPSAAADTFAVVPGDCVRFNGVRARIEVERVVAEEREEAAAGAGAPTAAAAAGAAATPPCCFRVRLVVECEGGLRTAVLGVDALCRAIGGSSDLLKELSTHLMRPFGAAEVNARRGALERLWESCAPPPLEGDPRPASVGNQHSVLHPREVARALLRAAEAESADGGRDVGGFDGGAARASAAARTESAEGTGEAPLTERGDVAQSLLERFVWRVAHKKGALAPRFVLPLKLPAAEKLAQCTYVEPCDYDPGSGDVRPLVLAKITLRVVAAVDRDGELTHRLALWDPPTAATDGAIAAATAAVTAAAAVEEEGKEEDEGTGGADGAKEAGAESSPLCASPPPSRSLIVLDGWTCDPSRISFTARGTLKHLTGALKLSWLSDKVRRKTADKVESGLRKLDRMLRPELLRALGVLNGVAVASGVWARLAEPLHIGAAESAAATLSEVGAAGAAGDVRLRLLPRAASLAAAGALASSERADDARVAQMLCGVARDRAAASGSADGRGCDAALAARVRAAATFGERAATNAVTETRGYDLAAMQRAHHFAQRLVQCAEASLVDVKQAWETRKAKAERERLATRIANETEARRCAERDAERLHAALERRGADADAAAAAAAQRGEELEAALAASRAAADERAQAITNACARKIIALREQHNDALRQLQAQ